MSSTIEYTLNEDEWTRVSTDETTVAVQPGDRTNILVFLGSVAPETDAPGFTIGQDTPDLPRAFSAGGLPAATSVWLRAAEGTTKAVVVAY